MYACVNLRNQLLLRLDMKTHTGVCDVGKLILYHGIIQLQQQSIKAITKGFPDLYDTVPGLYSETGSGLKKISSFCLCDIC